MARPSRTGKGRKATSLGSLSAPIELPDLFHYQRIFNHRGPFLVSAIDQRLMEIAVERQRREKMPALFARYGISPDNPRCWEELAFKLAIEHVPGFRVKDAAGRKRSESYVLFSELYRFFIRQKSLRWARTRRKPSDKEVCDAATKDGGFKSKFPELAKATSKRIQNLVSEAKLLRRIHLAALIQEIARARRIESNGCDFSQSGYIASSLPPRPPGHPSPLYRTYGLPGPQKPSRKLKRD